ncbi:neutral sphingomyelinase activation associated factor-like protein [Novymonas esmeraldas]|uniref:Neutral sphingomyelinase activation associated factor-like protein n=1 Tax=Novymonas esmeraldas TaxID=1808958 RepID=A0AAW0EW90_9TRYP
MGTGRRTSSRLTLYWLADKEWFLGEEECTRLTTGWLPLTHSTTAGTLSLASDHLFFDDGGAHILVLPLAAVVDASVHTCETHITVSFTCTAPLQRDVLVPPGGMHTVPGVSRPHPSKAAWVLRLSRAAESAAESLRGLFTRHRVEEIASRREAALQSAAASVCFRARRQVPMREQRGVLCISDSSVTFEPLFPLPPHGVVALHRRECRHTFKRWVVFEAVGLDVYTSDSAEAAPALSLIFENSHERDQATHLLSERLGVAPYRISIHTLVDAWRRGAVSNYEYLLLLNKWSSRCANDVFQYPVLPWVVADYTSARLDLTQPATFRDLRKPIGALSAPRLELLRERAAFLREAEETAYLYSTHYSSAGVVAYYLVRPHPELQLSLQGGILDVPERILESVPKLWRSVTTNSSNFRELIPEFYNDDFIALCGPPLLPLGVHADGSPVSAYVQLPPWATSGADFARQHRAALESDTVSASLHCWIDLVFGVAQAGERAVAADNLFHPFSYPPRVKQLSVPGVHLAAHEYAREFGSAPVQLFSEAHPPRTAQELVVACTPAAADACGCASESSDQQRLLQMMEELQRMDDLADVTGDSADGDDGDGDALPASAATLEVVTAVPLACRSARFITLGYATAGTVTSPSSSSSAAAAAAVLLVVGGDGRAAHLFDVATGDRVRTFPDLDGLITATAYHDGNMFVFTDNRSCYVVSLASRAVAHCIADVAPAPVVRACIASQLVVLADSNAQLLGWAVDRDAPPPVSLFEAPSTFAVEASARVACLGGSAEGDVVVAATEQLEVFVCHGGVCFECMLQEVSAAPTALQVMPAERPTRFWVFFAEEAALYTLRGLPLRRIALPVASDVLCAVVAGQLHPLRLTVDNDALVVEQLLQSGSSATRLERGGSGSPRFSCAGSLVACVGTSAAAPVQTPLVLTVVALTVRAAATAASTQDSH